MTEATNEVHVRVSQPGAWSSGGGRVVGCSGAGTRDKEATGWQDRFASFSRAYGRLREVVERDIATLNPLELEGTIHRFEFTFELGWKLLKDRLEHDGIPLPSTTPRAVVRAAYQAQLVEDGETWMDMLGDRNKTAHMYDADLVEDVVTAIHSRYLPAFAQLHAKTREQMRS